MVLDLFFGLFNTFLVKNGPLQNVLSYSHASAFVSFDGITTCSVIETVSCVAFVRFNDAAFAPLTALIVRTPVVIKWVWFGGKGRVGCEFRFQIKRGRIVTNIAGQSGEVTIIHTD